MGILALMLEPYMPDTAGKLLAQLNTSLSYLPESFGPMLNEGHKLGEPQRLFEEIDVDMAAEWRAKYGGKDSGVVLPTKVQLLPEDRAPIEADFKRLEKLVEEQRQLVEKMK